MGDQSLEEVYKATPYSAWPEVIRRLDVLWQDREVSLTVEQLEVCRQVLATTRREVATLTADNEALRAKNEALEEQLRRSGKGML